MMRSIFVTLIITLFTSTLFGQVSINTNGQPPDNSAMLDVASVNRGFLFPRLSTSGRNSIPSPARGLLIYNTTSKLFDFFNGSIWCQIGAFPVSSVTGTIRSGGGVSLKSVPDAVPDSSSMLDVNDATRGVLIPRTTSNLITSPVTGLIIYNLSTDHFNYYDGTSWRVLCSISTGAAGASGSQSPAGIAVNSNNSSPHPSAILDITASDKGLLIPRLTKNQRDAIKPVSGLTIFNLTSGSIEFYNGSGWYQMKVNLLTSPTPTTHVPEITQITWKWNKIPGEPYYKWNTTNNYETASNLGSDTSKTETGLTCNTSYTRYVWAYNDCGVSTATTLVKNTLDCSNPPNDYCAEANALFARMTVQPPLERKVIIDTLIRALKRDTIWSKLDFFYNFAVATEQQALLNWIKDAHNGTNYSMEFHADSGFLGGDATHPRYINTNYTPSTQAVNLELNNSGMGLYMWRDVNYTVSSIPLGAFDGSQSVYFITTTSVNKYIKINFNGAGGTTLDVTGGRADGFFYGGRNIIDRVDGRHNSNYVQSEAVVPSSALVTLPIYLGGRNNDGTPANFDGNTIGLAFMGADLTAYQYGAFLDHWNKYLINIGRKKVPMVVMGASTICARNNNGENCLSIADLMNDSVPGKNYAITSIATGAETIAQQLTRWNNLSANARRETEFVFMTLTGCDTQKWRTTKQMADDLNALIAKVATDIGVRHKIAMAPELPNHGWFDCYAPGGCFPPQYWISQDSVDLLHARHDSISDCIKGIGAFPIVRTDGGPLIRMGNYVETFTEGDGYLAAPYELPIPDHCHENGLARQIIADEWEQIYFTNK